MRENEEEWEGKGGEDGVRDTETKEETEWKEHEKREVLIVNEYFLLSLSLFCSKTADIKRLDMQLVFYPLSCILRTWSHAFLMSCFIFHVNAWQEEWEGGKKESEKKRDIDFFSDDDGNYSETNLIIQLDNALSGKEWEKDKTRDRTRTKRVFHASQTQWYTGNILSL